MAKKNYRVISDGEYTHPVLTDDEPDDYSVFSSLSQAKRNIIEDAKQRIEGLKDLIQKTRKLKVEDITEEEIS